MTPQTDSSSRRRLLRSVGAFLLAGAFTSALAQTRPAEEDSDVVVLNPFEVSSDDDVDYRASTATSATRLRMEIQRVPATISVITSEFIRDAAIDKLDDVLRYTPGADATDDVRGGGNSINIRGFIVNQVQFNGFTLAGDAAQLNSPLLASRVEIAKGPSSLLYGQIRPGGVFNLIPKTATLKNEGEAVASVGTSGYLRGELDVNRVLVDGKLSGRLYGFFQDQDYQADFAYREQYALMPSFKWRPNDRFELNGLLVRYFKDENPIPNQSNANILGSLDANGFPVDWTFTTPGNLRTGALTVPAQITNRNGTTLPTGTGAAGGRTRAGQRFDAYDLRWGPEISEHGPDSLNAIETFLFNVEGLVYFNEHVTSRTAFLRNESSRETNLIAGGNAIYGNGTGSTLRLEAGVSDYDESAWRQEFLGTFPLASGGKVNVLLGYEHRDIRSVTENWQVNNFITLAPAVRPTFENPHIDPALLRFPRGESGVRNHPALFNPATSIRAGFNRDDRDGYYGTVQLDLLEDRLFLLGGVRRDEAKQRNRDPRVAGSVFGTTEPFADTVYQFGVSYKLTKSATVFGSWSESALPNGFDQAGAPLAPETGEGWDLGVKFDRLLDGRATGSLTLFELSRNNIRRQQFLEDANGNFAGSIFRTSGEERSRGVEWDVSFKPLKPWTVLFGGAFLDAEIVKDPEDPEHEGLRTRGAPEWSLFAFTRYAFAGEGALSGLSLGGGITYQGETQAEDQFNRILRRTQPVTLADAFATYDFVSFGRNLEARLSVSNLFDTTKLARDKNWTEPREFRFSLRVAF